MPVDRVEELRQEPVILRYHLAEVERRAVRAAVAGPGVLYDLVVLVVGTVLENGDSSENVFHAVNIQQTYNNRKPSNGKRQLK